MLVLRTDHTQLLSGYIPVQPESPPGGEPCEASKNPTPCEMVREKMVGLTGFEPAAGTDGSRVVFNYPDKLRCHSRRTRSGALAQEGKSSLLSSLPTLEPRSHLISSKRRSTVARKHNHAPPIMGIPWDETKTVQTLTRGKHLVTNPPMVSPLTHLLTLKRTAVTCHAQVRTSFKTPPWLSFSSALV